LRWLATIVPVTGIAAITPDYPDLPLPGNVIENAPGTVLRPATLRGQQRKTKPDCVINKLPRKNLPEPRNQIRSPAWIS